LCHLSHIQLAEPLHELLRILLNILDILSKLMILG
jgi:hypothetical protein